MDESNAWESLVEFARPEEINTIIVGNYGWSPDEILEEDSYRINWEKEEVVDTFIPLHLRYRPLEPQKIQPYFVEGLLEYDQGFGSPECYAIYAYTDSRVIFAVQYDGSVSLHSIPLKPEGCVPEIPGR
jgi:hypothetical protein